LSARQARHGRPDDAAVHAAKVEQRRALLDVIRRVA
jgi:hypothetical protein